MPFSFARYDAPDAIPVQFVTRDSWPEIRRGMDAAVLAYADACGFEPNFGELPRGEVFFAIGAGVEPHLLHRVVIETVRGFHLDRLLETGAFFACVHR